MGAVFAVIMLALILYLVGSIAGWLWFLLSAFLFGLAWWVHDVLNSPGLSLVLVVISILILAAKCSSINMSY